MDNGQDVGYVVATQRERNVWRAAEGHNNNNKTIGDKSSLSAWVSKIGNFSIIQ